jgi:3-deoxy-D-manno-octulosonic-acid transferase
MLNFYDIAYGTGLVASAPVWLIRAKSRKKVVKALRERMGDVPEREAPGPAVLIHAVSLGEINATRALVAMLREKQPDIHVIVSTTTSTGFDQATRLYGKAENTTVIRYPLDFSSAIQRVLDRLKPAVVVLMELEVWPNFVKRCEQRSIPVIVVNARLTASSFANYRRGGFLVRKMFRRVAKVCAQDEAYAQRFRELGVPADRVVVTGTMKFDTAEVAEKVEGDDELARAVGLKIGEAKVWVCGSTGPGEEEIVLQVYRRISVKTPTLRLVIVPRHPERFDEVAQLIMARGFPCVRRSKGELMQGNRVVLGDSMGELRKWYSLADVVFVGRTLVDLGPRQHGSDMIEPAALGKPVIVGPWTGNFTEVMTGFREDKAIMEVKDEKELEGAVEGVLNQWIDGAEMGKRAQHVVRKNQGATARNVGIVMDMLDQTPAHQARQAVR